MDTRRKALVTLLFAGSIFPGSTSAREWDQWRGPSRNGVISPDQLPEEFPEEIELVWEVEAGVGHSSPIVHGEKIFLCSRTEEKEGLLCFDAKEGRPLWHKTYDAPYEMHNSARGHGKGPKSTPVAFDGRVITLGISGILTCYEASDGDILWQHRFEDKFKGTSPHFGSAMSPIVWGFNCIAHVGSFEDGALIAVDVDSGLIRWGWDEDGPAYGSPILAKIESVEQLVVPTASHVAGLNPKDGTVLWKVPFSSNPGALSCISPIVSDNRVIMSAYGVGTAAIKLAREGTEWKPEPDWSNRKYGFYMSTPALLGNQLYGLSDRRKGQFVCLDATSGGVVWQSPGKQGDNAALLMAGKHLLALTTGGDLIIFKSGGEEFEVLRQYKVADSEVWAHPAFYGGGMLIKSKEKLKRFRFGSA